MLSSVEGGGSSWGIGYRFGPVCVNKIVYMCTTEVGQGTRPGSQNVLMCISIIILRKTHQHILLLFIAHENNNTSCHPNAI